MKTALAVLPLAVLLTGCQAHGPRLETSVSAEEAIHFNPEGVHVMQPVQGQRFTPTTSVLVSYDTWTGQICRTYGWGGSVNDTGIEPCEWLANQRPPQDRK